MGEMQKVLQDKKDKKQFDENVRWILANQKDLIDNYPNRWVAIDNGAVQMAGPEFFPIFQAMHGRQVLGGSFVFYYAAYSAVPIILRHHQLPP